MPTSDRDEVLKQMYETLSKANSEYMNEVAIPCVHMPVNSEDYSDPSKDSPK